MVWWWIANLVGLVVVIPLVLVLAARVLRSALEIRRYAIDIAEHSGGIAANTEPVAEIERTREAAADVKDHAIRYATALDRLL